MVLKAKAPGETKPARPKVLLFGEPGVGKTFIACQFPRPYLCDSEAGATEPGYQELLSKAGGAYLGVDDGACDFATINEQLTSLQRSQHHYLTFVLDSVSKLFDSAVAAEEQRLIDSGKDPGKMYGAHKKPAVRSMRQMCQRLLHLDMTAILISHSKSLWKDGEVVGNQASIWDGLGYELSLVIEVYANGPARRARVHKSRLAGFGTGDTFDWNYETFAARFGEQRLLEKPEIERLATAEQLATIGELEETIDLDHLIKAKWFAAFSVTDWPELTEDEANRAIAHMENLIPQHQH